MERLKTPLRRTMGESTWYNITHNMYKAVYKGYMTKSKRQRNKKEVWQPLQQS